MRKGSFFISLTKRLPSSEFEVLEYEMYRMSWGEATVFIMQKVTECNEEVEEGSDDEEEGGGAGAAHAAAGGGGGNFNDDDDDDEE